MVITFVVDDKVVPIDYKGEITSKVVQSLVDSTTGTITVNIPDYYVNAIYSYDYYVGKHNQCITTKQHLKLCFKLADYLEDSGYFQFILTQFFNHWSSASSILYKTITAASNDDNDTINLGDEIKYEIFLRCPHDFLPTGYINNKIFMKEWNLTNVNVDVLVDGNVVYHINHTTMYNDHKVVTNYHTNCQTNINHYNVDCDYEEEKEQDEGFKMVTTFDSNGNIIDYETYEDGKQHGIWKRWYVKHYDDDNNNKEKETGGNLESETTYVNGKKHGAYKQWYYNTQRTENSQLAVEGQYHNGVKQGIWQEWYKDDCNQLMCKGNYLDGKEHGPWKYWHLDGKITGLGCYEHGKRQGLWFHSSYGNNDVYLTSQGPYRLDKKHGEWITRDHTGTVINRHMYYNGETDV